MPEIPGVAIISRRWTPAFLGAATLAHNYNGGATGFFPVCPNVVIFGKSGALAVPTDWAAAIVNIILSAGGRSANSGKSERGKKPR